MNPMVCMTMAPRTIVWPIFTREERLHVLGADEHERDGQRRRQAEQHVAGEAAVRGVHAHLPQDLEPLAHHVGEVVEDLGEVAAGLALDRRPPSRRTARP